jgi:hypothetical protein
MRSFWTQPEGTGRFSRRALSAVLPIFSISAVPSFQPCTKSTPVAVVKSSPTGSWPSRPLLVGLHRSAKYKRCCVGTAGPLTRLHESMIPPRRERHLLDPAQPAPVDRCPDCSGAGAESEQHAPIRLR